MTDYRAPLRDQLFVIEHIAGLADLGKLERFEHADIDTVSDLLDEAARFFEEVLAPLNRTADTVGATFADGKVTTPPGFADAYASFVEAGWNTVPFEPAFGGGGFPWLIGLAVQEMLTSASMGFGLCPLLSQGAVDLLTAHGTPEQQDTYLGRLITGEWSGTMNLTEPEAGSDVGALRTKAEPNGDGTYSISGQKIFITYGDHDMTENVVHLVLARTPDAPAGTRGISCFIVPKFLPNPDGSPGEANNLSVVSIEHKVGIHASPTCVMSFDKATGFLIGEELAGMKAMFTMMNSARLSVGLQGLAVAERAYQEARDYARERVQGKPIVEHPDVRRMLMVMRSSIEALRCLHYRNAAAMDRAHHGADDAERAEAEALVALLTPISKAWGSDLGVELTSLAIQVHGGMGYVEETGVAQHWRDSRIAPIYEGTNGIQAADLVGRKLPMAGGQVVKNELAAMRSVSDDMAGSADLADLAGLVGDAIDELGRTSEWMLGRMPDAFADALTGSVAYLRQFGVVGGAVDLARSALIARSIADASGAAADVAFAEDKVAVCRFFIDQILPEATAAARTAQAGAASTFAISADRL